MFSELSSFLMIAFLGILSLLLFNKMRRLQTQEVDNLTKNGASDLEGKIIEMSRNGKSSVEIIKYVRVQRSLALDQAKLYVDKVLAKQDFFYVLNLLTKID